MWCGYLRESICQASNLSSKVSLGAKIMFVAAARRTCSMVEKPAKLTVSI